MDAIFAISGPLVDNPLNEGGDYPRKPPKVKLTLLIDASLQAGQQQANLLVQWVVHVPGLYRLQGEQRAKDFPPLRLRVGMPAWGIRGETTLVTFKGVGTAY